MDSPAVYVKRPSWFNACNTRICYRLSEEWDRSKTFRQPLSFVGNRKGTEIHRRDAHYAGSNGQYDREDEFTNRHPR